MHPAIKSTSFEPAAKPTHYVIWDNGGIMRQAAGPVGKPYSCRKRARTRADRLDLEYGAYRYSVRPVYAPEVLANMKTLETLTAELITVRDARRTIMRADL